MGNLKQTKLQRLKTEERKAEDKMRKYEPQQARTQDFEKGGSEYRVVAIRPRRGGGCSLASHTLLAKGCGFARSFYTMDDLECQIFIQIYREKITETTDLSSPSFLDASVKTFYKHYLLSISVS